MLKSIDSGSFVCPSFGQNTSIEDSQVDGNDNDDKNVIQKTKYAIDGFRYHVQRTDQVHDAGDETENDADTKKVDKASGEKFDTQVT